MLGFWLILNLNLCTWSCSINLCIFFCKRFFSRKTFSWLYINKHLFEEKNWRQQISQLKYLYRYLSYMITKIDALHQNPIFFLFYKSRNIFFVLEIFYSRFKEKPWFWIALWNLKQVELYFLRLMLMTNLKFIERIHVWQVLCGLLDYQSNCVHILKQIHMYFNVTRVLHPYYNYILYFS